MAELSIGLLGGILCLLIILSGFFSGSEIGMLSLNRYRLKHWVQKGQVRARRVQDLLKRPDRLLGVILIGNTFANILASAIATMIAVRLWGDIGVLISTVLLTLVILIFSEMAPKTLAALYPEKVAFVVARPLKLLYFIFAPLVWLTSFTANNFLRLFGIRVKHGRAEQLSREELRTVVRETGSLIPGEHKKMLVNILDLEQVTLEDIMVPSSEILGIDISESWSEVLAAIETCQHTRIPVFDGEMNNPIGMLHLKKIAKRLVSGELTKKEFIQGLDPCYFVPEGTNLYQQLLEFRRAKQRVSLVVDEYGDIQGLVTLEDILEEVVGEFTTDFSAINRDITPQPDGSVVIDASITIRELNRLLKLNVKTDGPRTLSGLIIEHLEAIPPAGSCCKIDDLSIEILQVQQNKIKTVKLPVTDIS